MEKNCKINRKKLRQYIKEALDNKVSRGIDTDYKKNELDRICRKFEMLYDVLDELIELTEFQGGSSPQLNLNCKCESLGYSTLHQVLCVACDTFNEIVQKIKDGKISYKTAQEVEQEKEDEYRRYNNNPNESIARKVTKNIIKKLNESDSRWTTDPQSVVLNSAEELETFVQENLDYDKCTMLEFNKSIRFSVDNGVRVWVENEYGERYWQSISEVSSYDYYEELEEHSKDGKYYLTNYEWHKGI